MSAARRLAVAAVLLAALARPAAAQTDSASRPDARASAAVPAPPRAAAPAASAVPGAVRWGKWAAASLAAGFTVLGIHQHDVADRAFASLVGYCGTVTCTLAADGRYADPAAEATYQRVVRNDRSARAWFIAGEAAAVGTAALFVVQLLHPTEEPNIPYSGLQVDSRNGVLRLSVRIPVRIGDGETMK